MEPDTLVREYLRALACAGRKFAGEEVGFYTSTYVEGYRLLRGWLDDRPADVSVTERFGRLLDEPLIPSSLRG